MAILSQLAQLGQRVHLQGEIDCKKCTPETTWPFLDNHKETHPFPKRKTTICVYACITDLSISRVGTQRACLSWANVGKPLYIVRVWCTTQPGPTLGQQHHVLHIKIRKQHIFLCWLYNVGQRRANVKKLVVFRWWNNIGTTLGQHHFLLVSNRCANIG